MRSDNHSVREGSVRYYVTYGEVIWVCNIVIFFGNCSHFSNIARVCIQFLRVVSRADCCDDAGCSEKISNVMNSIPETEREEAGLINHALLIVGVKSRV